MRTEPQPARPHPHHWNDLFQPIPPPPAHGPPPTSPTHSPIRDASRLGPTEDIDREPDGVPHSVVGATAAFSVMLAVLLVSVWFVSSWTSRAFVILLLVVAVPVVVTSLTHKADRDRDRVHPSR